MILKHEIKNSFYYRCKANIIFISSKSHTIQHKRTLKRISQCIFQRGFADAGKTRSEQENDPSQKRIKAYMRHPRLQKKVYKSNFSTEWFAVQNAFLIFATEFVH